MAKKSKPIAPGTPPIKSETQKLAEELKARKSQSFTATVMRRYICLYLTVHTNMTAEEIAVHLGEVYGVECTAQTVAADLWHQRKRWAETVEMDTTKLVERELTDLEAAREMVVMLHGRGETKEAIETLLKIQKRRSMLLGLDKPIKIELGVKRAESLTDAEIAEEQAKLEERRNSRLIDAPTQGGVA